MDNTDYLISDINGLCRSRDFGFSEEQIERIGRMMAAVETKVSGRVNVRLAASTIEAILIFLKKRGTGPRELKMVQEYLLFKIRESSNEQKQ